MQDIIISGELKALLIKGKNKNKKTCSRGILLIAMELNRI